MLCRGRPRRGAIWRGRRRAGGRRGCLSGGPISGSAMGQAFSSSAMGRMSAVRVTRVPTRDRTVGDQGLDGGAFGDPLDGSVVSSGSRRLDGGVVGAPSAHRFACLEGFQRVREVLVRYSVRRPGVGRVATTAANDEVGGHDVCSLRWRHFGRGRAGCSGGKARLRDTDTNDRAAWCTGNVQ